MPSVLEPLAVRYPSARLRRVALYEPKRGDTSMGRTLDDGTVLLNAYWFARDPAALRKAAEKHPSVIVGGITIGWHAYMPEPPQLLTHEFFHAVRNGAPVVMDWANDAWSACTRYPELAPSGYSLSDPEEFWAEAMALRELGFPFFLLDDLEQFLRKSGII